MPAMQVDPTLRVAALAGLELAINKALQLDPSAGQQLAQLAPCSLQINCEDYQLQLFILLQDQQVQLLQHYEEPCSAVISGPSSAFIELLSSEDKGAAMISGDLQLQGNSQLLLQLQAILMGLELDWEGKLADLIGDIPSHLIGQKTRQLWQHAKRSKNKFEQHLHDFVLEEARLLPSRAEAEEFYQQLNELQHRCDRLGAKLNKAQQKQPPSDQP